MSVATLLSVSAPLKGVSKVKRLLWPHFAAGDTEWAQSGNNSSSKSPQRLPMG